MPEKFTVKIDSKTKQKLEEFLLKQRYGIVKVGDVTISWQLISEELDNEIAQILLESAAGLLSDYN